MDILGAEATLLFVGTEDEPRQVVRARLRATSSGEERASLRVSVQGEGLTSEPVAIDGAVAGASIELEIGVLADRGLPPGTTLDAELVVEGGSTDARHPFGFVVAEPGWRMFMISHFHYDPVWWNTQAAYTETWGRSWMFRSPFQEPGLALVRAHLDMCRRDPDYKFVLAELDYLKPYWDVYPEDRQHIRRLLAEGRLELMGGTYNEPNTNLTSAETTIRNAIYGTGYQRDVLGGSPATAWQLDAFGHDPQFPGIMADAGLTSSSWARGPFHEWGPNWRRGSTTLIPVWADLTEPTAMQFPSEFEWISPSGKSLLTCFMANHYSAGWWMDAAPTLEAAEREVLTLFRELASVAATRNVLLPVGTDYTPPNRWLTAIHRDWARRYVWPKFVAAIPREFFDAVRAERAAAGRTFSPQTRDMNPIYTGKDVSFIDTKQAQRAAENTLLSAEKLATLASLMGARYPSEAIDKAWRQLLFGAHHDGITGSESDQVYLDLLGGWREAMELSSAVVDGAISHLGERIDTTGPGRAVVVFNTLSWPRTDLVRVEVPFAVPGVRGLRLIDAEGGTVPFVVEALDQRDDGSLVRVVLAFMAADVPAVGYRTYRAVEADALPDDAAWTAVEGTAIENERYRVEVDPDRGGAITELVEKRSGKRILRPGGLGNELLAYREYPNHPLFGEGPWHLTPDGTHRSSAEAPADVAADQSPIGQRLRVRSSFGSCHRTQDIYLWDGAERVDFVTHIDDFTGSDELLRVRFDAHVEGATAVSEVANATVGRGFGFPNADVARIPFTLDHPAYDWFGLSATARIVLVEEGATADEPTASRATSVAEVIATDAVELDGALRELMVALVRAGVTATLGRGDGSRYGTLAVDSNLPDLRIALGGPDDNAFVSRLLAAVDAEYARELARQLDHQAWARLWVPAERPLADVWRGDADLRATRSLPVLIVAGPDRSGTVAAIEELVSDLEDTVVTVEQRTGLGGTVGRVEDYTVAVLNHGVPSFNVEADGSLYLSFLRSCSGWPSGVWIDPPRRTVPDGSNFQFQHWSHRFDYALIGASGDWRQAEIVRAGHGFNNALIGRVLESHAGVLPASESFVRVEPSSAVMTTLKAAGDPLARLSSADQDPTEAVVMRLYESSGCRTRVRIDGALALAEPSVTDVLEASRRRIVSVDGAIELDLDPFEITTLRARPALSATDGIDGRERSEIGPRREPAQPVFADQWLHDKGPAPMGYQPVTVQIRPGRASGGGPFSVPIAVASSVTDGTVEGFVSVVSPPGWTATPAERPYRLAPGAHAAFEASVAPSPDAPDGRYFVAARIEDDAGQIHEDVMTIDLVRDGSTRSHPGRSDTLEGAIERTMRRVDESVRRTGPDGAVEPIGGELDIRSLTPEIRVRAGDRADLRVRLHNLVADEIRGEAQLISPHETWRFTTPWTQGFAVAAGEEMEISFAIEPTSDVRPGAWWALVKVMYFGRLWYTESASIEVLPRS